MSSTAPIIHIDCLRDIPCECGPPTNFIRGTCFNRVAACFIFGVVVVVLSDAGSFDSYPGVLFCRWKSIKRRVPTKRAFQ